MRKFFLLLGICAVDVIANAQVTAQRFTNYTSAEIGVYMGTHIREAGFSGLYHIPGTGLEFFTVSDRGFSAAAGKTPCGTGKEKVIPYPAYAPKIHRMQLAGDSIQIVQTISIKRPDGTDATGMPPPVGAGNAGETLWANLPADCSKVKVLGTDAWGVDPEGICLAADNTFWICEEFGTSIWHLDAAGKVIKRYSPFGDGDHQVGTDTVMRYRKANHGYEGIAIAPNGKVYGFMQSTMPFPSKKVLDSTRIMRILEIDPKTNKTRMFAYINDGTVTVGTDRINPKDWKIGDAAAINNNEFLVIEHDVKGANNHQLIYRINIANATPIKSNWVDGKTIEQYYNAAGLAAIHIKPVEKTRFMDLVANGWDPKLDKPEDMAIVNDSTLAVGIDNDFGVEGKDDATLSATGINPVIYIFSLKGDNKIKGYSPPSVSNTVGMKKR